MKKISVAIVISAALVAGAVAQQSNNNKNHPKPASQKHSKTSPKGTTHTTPKPFTGPKQTTTGMSHQSNGFGNRTQTTTGTGNTTHLVFNRQATAGNGRTGHGRVGMGTGNTTAVKGTGKPLTGQMLHTGHPVTGKPGVFALKNAPAVQRGVNAPPKSAFAQPSAPISSHNFPAPHQGNTYITNNTTVINNNYNYDAQHYQPHVSNFYGYQNPGWGGHWRYGCYQPAGASVTFGFGFYVYTPFYAACVASPFYYYPGVPAYIPQGRVVVVDGYSRDWSGNAYDYRPGVAYGSYGVPNLNKVVNTVQEVFANSDANSMRTIIGGNQIAIFSEGNYEYSLNGTEFLQMLTDNIAATQTVSYTITKVYQRGISAVVEAAHTFNDPTTGGETTVYHRYRLQQNSYNWYAITDFMTSHTPFGGADGAF
ncbi:MAG TPA: hypothetical protein VGL56_14635 [Fimbriimonadaceae bacterium]